MKEQISPPRRLGGPRRSTTIAAAFVIAALLGGYLLALVDELVPIVTGRPHGDARAVGALLIAPLVAVLIASLDHTLRSRRQMRRFGNAVAVLAHDTTASVVVPEVLDAEIASGALEPFDEAVPKAE